MRRERERGREGERERGREGERERGREGERERGRVMYFIAQYHIWYYKLVCSFDSSPEQLQVERVPSSKTERLQWNESC
jgi:hypothetical protein